MIDNISYGRLDCGFVRGVPYELFASNRNPTETSERLESIDLIKGLDHPRRALQLRRQMDPQAPGERLAASLSAAAPARVDDGRQRSGACLPDGGARIHLRHVLDASRPAVADVQGRAFLVQRPGPTAPGGRQIRFHATRGGGRDRKEAREVIERVFWYVVNNKAEPQHRAPPGYVETSLYADFLSGRFTGGRTDAIRKQGMEYFRENHVAIYGTPENVVGQINVLAQENRRFRALGRDAACGDMDFDVTAKSMTLFAEKVAPHLKDLGTVSRNFGPLRKLGGKKAA